MKFTITKEMKCMADNDSIEERERRFFVDGRDEKPWRSDRVINITQHYLPRESLSRNGTVLEYNGVALFSLTEKEQELFSAQDGWGARLRTWNDTFIFTSKTKKNDDTDYEIEREISKDIYQALLENQHFPHIVKTRYLWDDVQGLTWEVDEFEGVFAGWVVAEVELTEGQEIAKIPPWAGKEITSLGDLSNRSLAMMANKLMS